ncbi:hypothetical protein SO802_004559 [Lithocarpus litseifolius]|uniref:Uncharacterized protein n=1 Tax=Lithocarpus litseifolius TaxID=425828 RepID=A0AAW2E3A6_9ROSI
MPGFNRGQLLLLEKGKERQRIAEEVGGTAVECATICCCCPCSLVNLVILALYRFPAGLCKKTWKRRRLLKMKKKAFILHNNNEAREISDLIGACGSELGRCESVLVTEMWIGVNRSGSGLDRRGSECVGVGRSGSECVKVDRSASEWAGVDQNGSEWVGS